MNATRRTVSELGEFGLIDRIRARLRTPDDDAVWTGDDAAVLTWTRERLVFTTDGLVEGVDFDLSWCHGADVGWKAVAVNLSDVAAMGGRPRYAVAALNLRPDTLVAVVDGILQGLIEATERYGVRLVGGDIGGASELSVTVSALGGVDVPVRRAGARPGDRICVTGALGGAAGGLIALRRGLAGPGPTEGHPFPPALAGSLTRLAERQLRPQPRIEEGIAVARHGGTAMIDVSDGLVADLRHVTTAGGVGCDVDSARVPIDRDLEALASAVSDERVSPQHLALAGGEDFELVFTIPEPSLGPARAALEDLGTDVTEIGSITDGDARIDGRPLGDWKEAGWEHLRDR